MKNDLKDLSELILKANQERTKEIISGSSKLKGQISNIENSWGHESAERFSSKYSPRLNELVNEISEIKKEWDEEFKQEQLLMYEERAKLNSYIDATHAFVSYPGGLSLVKAIKFNDLIAKISE